MKKTLFSKHPRLSAKRTISETDYQRSGLSAKRTKRIPQDIIGNIAILKFPRKTLKIIKFLKARKFLKTHKNVTTIVEKTDKIQGQLRISKTKHLAGIKTKIATYKENNCTFKFNIDESYFSPRLSNERKIIADKVNKLIPQKFPKRNLRKSAKSAANFSNKQVTPTKILIMFAGIAPYPIIIAKRLLKAKGQKLKANFHIYSNELNKQANKEAKKNIQINKLQNYITLLPGNAKNLPTPRHPEPRTPQNYEVILMPRPNLDDTFLKTALKLSKKGTVIFYHGFGKKQEVINEIKENTNHKITKIKIRKAGDIAPYKYRWQAQFKVK